MLCRNCGKELEDEWVNCPYCGCNISGNENTGSRISEKNVLDDKRQIDEEAVTQDRSPYHIHEKIEYRDFWRYIILSLVTCGIYGVYVLCGYVKDINKICEGDGQESNGFIIVLLLTMITGGIYGIYWWYIQGERLYNAALKYGIKLRENGKSILLWLIPANIIMLGGGTLVANYIMFDNMNLIAKMYNGDMSEEELLKAGKPHPNLIQNVWAVYGILLVVGVILIASAIRSDSFEGANAQSEEWLENTVNEQSGASDTYDDPAENDHSYESTDEGPVEGICGIITDTSDNALMIEEIYQGESTWITIDSYDFSYDEYHQCSDRNDLEDLEHAGIGDIVFLVRPLDKTQDTIALCFEILERDAAEALDEPGIIGTPMAVSEPTVSVPETPQGSIVMESFIGTWQDTWSKRATMEIMMVDGKLHFYVQWANSAADGVIWNFVSDEGFDPEYGTIGYYGNRYEWNEQHPMEDPEQRSSDEHGVFKLEANGYLHWYDNSDYSNCNCIFEKIAD